MSPKASKVQEIFALLDSVQSQLQQIRERAKDLIDADTLNTDKTKKEAAPND